MHELDVQRINILNRENFWWYVMNIKPTKINDISKNNTIIDVNDR